MASTDNRYSFDFTIIGTLAGIGIGILTPIAYTLYTEHVLNDWLVGGMILGVLFIMMGVGWVGDLVACYYEEHFVPVSSLDKHVEELMRDFLVRDADVKKFLQDMPPIDKSVFADPLFTNNINELHKRIDGVVKRLNQLEGEPKSVLKNPCDEIVLPHVYNVQSRHVILRVQRKDCKDFNSKGMEIEVAVPSDVSVAAAREALQAWLHVQLNLNTATLCTSYLPILRKLGVI